MAATFPMKHFIDTPSWLAKRPVPDVTCLPSISFIKYRMADKKHWLEPPAWWKKVKPLRWLAIGGILFLGFSAVYTAKVLIAPAVHEEAAKFTAVASDPVPFLDGLRSYDTVAAVRSLLEGKQVVAQVDSQHLPASSKHPPRDRDTLTASFVHLGESGKLTLEFFNDRLYEATFVPKDAEAYAGRLHAADPRLKREPSNRIEFINGPLRIASNVDFAATEVGKNLRTKPFVIWQDTRLVEALDEWDRRFVVPVRRD